MARSATFLIILALLLAGCARMDRAGLSEPERAGSAPSMDGTRGTGLLPTGQGEDAAPVPDEAAADDAGTDAEGEGQDPPAGDLDLPGVTSPVSVGERIIKDGTVSVEVEAGRFDIAFGRVIAAATSLGGTVVSSDTTTADTGGTSGSVTVRVPVERYEDLLVDVGEIGTVLNRRITAQDVTDEFTDLESRLRHLRAQERFYLGLLEEATSVGDAIAVQQQLDGVQAQMEQVQGRIQLLDARTTFSTLTVELFEPGTPLELAGTRTDRPHLARYWAQARDAFVNVVGGMLVAVFFIAPLLVPVTAGYLIWQALRRRPATTPAE